jgi:hypothetical protein
MDGVFKLFNALTRVKKRLEMEGALNALVKFTKRSKKTAQTIVALDKENMDPQMWQDSLNAIDGHHQKSRTLHNKNQLCLNKNTSTTFSFNNTGNQEENLHTGGVNSHLHIHHQQ